MAKSSIVTPSLVIKSNNRLFTTYLSESLLRTTCVESISGETSITELDEHPLPKRQAEIIAAANSDAKSQCHHLFFFILPLSSVLFVVLPAEPEFEDAVSVIWPSDSVVSVTVATALITAELPKLS